MQICILSHTSESYAHAISSRLGKGYQHALLIYKEWFQKGKVSGSDPHFSNARSLFEEIVGMTDFSVIPLEKKRGEGSTVKYLLHTADGLEVEMVVLPMSAGWTVCLSSQIGCKMGCSFCETGKMGLLRSLSTQEIVSQVFHAKHSLGLCVRNTVFMGMGEPLDNYDEVMRAVGVLTDAHAFALGPSRITISTSGVVDKIYRLIEEVNPAINLAVSVNASNDEIRNQLMPVNRKFNMAALKEAMKLYVSHPRRRIFIEYVLIKGRTDFLEAADQLAEYLRGLRVTVNLIPYNPQSRDCFESPEIEVIEVFLNRMKSHGFLTFVRGTKGQKIMAACGQLGNRELRKKQIYRYSQ